MNEFLYDKLLAEYGTLTYKEEGNRGEFIKDEIFLNKVLRKDIKDLIRLINQHKYEEIEDKVVSIEKNWKGKNKISFDKTNEESLEQSARKERIRATRRMKYRKRQLKWNAYKQLLDKAWTEDIGKFYNIIIEKKDNRKIDTLNLEVLWESCEEGYHTKSLYNEILEQELNKLNTSFERTDGYIIVKEDKEWIERHKAFTIRGDKIQEMIKIYWEHMFERKKADKGYRLFKRNNKQVQDTMPDFGTDNIKRQIKRGKKNTAPGISRISYSVMSHLEGKMLDRYTQIIEKIWTSRCIPESWKEGIITLIPKVGKGYRP